MILSMSRTGPGAVRITRTITIGEVIHARTARHGGISIMG